MNTSGGGLGNALLYVVALVVSLLLGRALVAPDVERRFPYGALGLWLLVAVPSMLQGVFPGLLTALRRTPASINNDGEWWRVVTSVLVQDGGFVGTALNLVVLAVVAVVADRVWGTSRMFVVFGCGQLIFGLLTTFVDPSVGAGNSGATFALAASMAGLMSVVGPRRRDVILIAIVVACGVVLIALRDAHAEAFLFGAVIGAVLGVVWPPQLATLPVR